MSSPPRTSLTRQFLDVRFFFIAVATCLLLVLSYFGAFLLRFDFRLHRTELYIFWITLPTLLIIKLPVFYVAGLFRGWWKYIGMSDLLDIATVSAFSGILLFAISRQVHAYSGFPRSVPIIDAILTILIIGGTRFLVRLYSETVQRELGCGNAIIVGAGHAGRHLAQELKTNPDLRLNPVAFIDDDVRKYKIKIHGIKVVGGRDKLPDLIAKTNARCVLIAMPSAPRPAVLNIVEICQPYKVDMKILSPLAERINGGGTVRRMRDVCLEDLLGRQPVQFANQRVRAACMGKVVLVTGAGGSIGSEICRQAAMFNPASLVLFERSENDLHRVDMELRKRFPKERFISVIGDILDVSLLRQTMSENRPDIVFHAAAYKHVPMMEDNCFQAVKNNVFGTYNVALVARQYAVDSFVLISSDKAVKPSNIMGVTKRLAELVTLSLQDSRTRYIGVRFGNVLGSNGSVVPLFERQIAAGGPVTITHPDATRYFMTIPEATQLVLEASTMGARGEIFVLDMGEPIKIVDLAHNLIRLAGLEPNVDIDIVFTGLRPGEKLFEELRLQDERLKPTSQKRLRVLEGQHPPFETVQDWLDDLSFLVESNNVNGLVEKLKEIVPEYTPSPHIRMRCDVDRHDFGSRYRRARHTLTLGTDALAS